MKPKGFIALFLCAVITLFTTFAHYKHEKDEKGEKLFKNPTEIEKTLSPKPKTKTKKHFHKGANK